nr:MAG TPA: transmembrane protein [Caudoviricetes sp.]
MNFLFCVIFCHKILPSILFFIKKKYKIYIVIVDLFFKIIYN